jgi:hypothetical protein
MVRTGLAAGLLLAASAAAVVPWRSHMALPDRALTPGAVRTTSAAEACARPLPPRPDQGTWWHLKREAMRSYHLTGLAARDFELDHLIPREIGGADLILNLWPQPWPQARRKDRLENEMASDFCLNDHSDEGLAALQRWFAAGRWRDR